MIACDPSAVVIVHLQADADKPAGKRPEFTYRVFTVREDAERSRLAREAVADGNTPEQYVETLGKLLGVGLVTWRNLVDPDGKAVPFKAGEAGEALRALTDAEAWELLRTVTRETALSEQKKRQSQSPSPSNAEKSAEPAPATAASA